MIHRVFPMSYHELMFETNFVKSCVFSQINKNEKWNQKISKINHVININTSEANLDETKIN